MARIVNLKRFPSNIADRISRAQAARGGRNTSVSSTPQTDAQKREAEIEAAFDYSLTDFIGYDQVAETDKQLKNSIWRAVDDTNKQVQSDVRSFDIAKGDTSIYPGKLVKINKKNFLKNGPQDLAVGVDQRADKMIIVEAGSQTVSKELVISKHAENDTNGFITNAINECFKQNNGKPLGIKTVISFNGEEIFTKEHLDTKVTCNIPSIKTNTEVSTNSDKQENHVLYKVTQVFYKAKFDASSNISPASYFKLENVNQKMIDLLNTCKKEMTPVAYVSEVSYGRVIYLMLSSTLSTEKIKMSLDIKADGIADISADMNSESEKKTIKVCVEGMGGGMKQIAALSSVTMSDFLSNRDKYVQAITDVLNDYEFKNTEYAVPISYKLKYLKNNEDVIIENSFKDVDVADQIKVTFKAGNLGSAVRIYPRYIAPRDIDGDGKLDWEIFKKESKFKVTAHLTGESVYIPARARFVQFSVSNDIVGYTNQTVIFDRLPLKGSMKNEDGEYVLEFKVSGTRCNTISLNAESNFMQFNQKYSLYEKKDYSGCFKNGTTITGDDASDAGFYNTENYVEYLANTDFEKYSNQVDNLNSFIKPSRTQANDQKERLENKK